MDEALVAESSGMFQYKPDAASFTTDEPKFNSTVGLEKEEKPNYFSPPLNNHTSSLPPPLVPSATIQKGPPPPENDEPDEFLDPELDLELDGMNLDGDAGVSISTIILYCILYRNKFLKWHNIIILEFYLCYSGGYKF